MLSIDLFTSDEVQSAVLLVTSGLDVLVKAKVAGLLDHRTINEELVSGVVHLCESVIVCACNTESGKEPNSSEPEEV